MPPSVIQSPLHQVRSPKPQLHGGLHRGFFVHAAIEDEMGKQCAGHPVGAGAVHQQGPVLGGPVADHFQDLIHHPVVEGALADAQVEILHAQLTNQRGLVEGTGLHGVANVEDHLAPGVAKGSERGGAGLPRGGESGEWQGGVGHPGEGLEEIGHSRKVSGERRAESGKDLPAHRFPLPAYLWSHAPAGHRSAQALQRGLSSQPLPPGRGIRHPGRRARATRSAHSPRNGAHRVLRRGGGAGAGPECRCVLCRSRRAARGIGSTASRYRGGLFELWRTRLHNSALVATLGGTDPGIRHVHRKVFLPTYGVFDEERFVEPGRSVRAFDTRWGRAAVIVCEDAWHSLVPTIAALDGAQVLIVVSASPARGLAPDEGGEERPASLLRWERTIQAIAGEHGIYVALAQLVGFEGDKAFPGGSLVVGPRGDVLARAQVFEEDLLRVTVELDEIPRVRADMPMLYDLEIRLPHLLDALRPSSRGADRRGDLDEIASGPVAPRNDGRALAPQPSRLGARSDPLAIDPELTRKWLVEFLRDEVD